jgi:SAM-dependent methyltransferase
MDPDPEDFKSDVLQCLAMRRDWDERAAVGAREYIVSGLGHSTEEFSESGRRDAQHLSQFCTEKSIVLDLGCGIGRISGPLEAHVKQIVAVDVSEEMICQARKYVGRESKINFYVNDGASIGMIEADSVDFAFSLLTLHHIPRSIFTRYLTELFRVLRSGGLFYFSILIDPRSQNSSDDGRDTFSGRSYSDSFISELLSCKFEIVERFYPHGVAHTDHPLRVEYLTRKLAIPFLQLAEVRGTNLLVPARGRIGSET